VELQRKKIKRRKNRVKNPVLSLDLFNNPIGYRTSPCKMLRILMFFSGSCSETSVSEQLYCVKPTVKEKTRPLRQVHYLQHRPLKIIVQVAALLPILR
jgi:hypothetical protein